MNAVTTMEILVFKTNIQHKKDVRRISTVLEPDNRIMDWNVDRWDVDNVLRIASLSLAPEEVINIVNNAGYFCEELPD